MDQALAIQDGRARTKMSQEHLASAAGISARTVVRAERGLRVSGESLRNMCAVLGLDATSIAPVAERQMEEADNGDAACGDAPGLNPAGQGTAPPAPSVIEGGGEVGGAAPNAVKGPLWRRLLALRRAPIEAVIICGLFVSMSYGLKPMYDRLTILGDTGRWVNESYPAKATAAHVNALAAGKSAGRPPVMSYYVCRQGDLSLWRYLRLYVFNDCQMTRYEILVDSAELAGGFVQTIVGPVGQEFGRDLARRLSGDPKVRWRVAFASGRQATGLAWFDPRAIPTQDMPRPPDATATWVYVELSKARD